MTTTGTDYYEIRVRGENVKYKHVSGWIHSLQLGGAIMALRFWLHWIHIVGAVIWVGGGLMLSVVGARARQSEDPRTIGEFAQMLSYVGPRVLTPAVVAVVASGVWLVLASPGWSFTQLWVILALGAFVVAFLIGAVYLSRIALELERFATRADASLQAARDILGRWIVGYRVVLLILLFVLWDMVFKPGL
jgi:uncharacterized membrane protein